MTEDTAWRVTGLMLRASSSFCFASVQRTTGKTRVRNCVVFLIFIYIYVYIYFLCRHVFHLVSELDYLLLEHVVINDDLDLCFWDMSRQGGS